MVQVDEVVTNLHLSYFRSVAASWEETGQNQSPALLLSVFLEGTGLNPKHLFSVFFSVEVTDQSLNRAFLKPSWPPVIVYRVMMSWAFFEKAMKLKQNELVQ